MYYTKAPSYSYDMVLTTGYKNTIIQHNSLSRDIIQINESPYMECIISFNLHAKYASSISIKSKLEKKCNSKYQQLSHTYNCQTLLMPIFNE
jgi:hypothetical protein